ncbi:YkvA family protein [Pleomorphomonas sp. NRK KF1]|uniref:YkvA family protein n=1 Tax=Pleomorphomonas sp. NRK KF1 TaxID=2943000 RepID=UPI0020A72D89|nr:YkvA family protein [Pleomorphomonas sp. NRK KF1]
MRKAHHPDPEIIGPADGHEARVRSRFWKTIRKAIASIPFLDEVVAAYYCALDPETPAPVRATLLAALAYFVVPFDILPDFVLGLGFTDDITVLITAIGMVRGNIGEQHRAAARAALDRLAAEKTG